MDRPVVSIIIVNWNTREILRACLRSIHENAGVVDFQIIVVDNASTDGSAAMVANDFGQVRLIANTENRGFAAANNQGIAVARGRYVLLLNSDTLILDHAIARTVAYADQHPEAAVVGCQVWTNATTIQATCFAFPSLWDVLVQSVGLHHLFPRSRWFARGPIGWWDRSDEREVDVVSGMFMLVRRAAIEEVGAMDEDYFVYGEETDWCYRFKKAGWRCLFAPVARIIHLDGGGKSTDQVSVKMYVQLHKSTLLFFRKQRGWPSWVAARVLLGLSMALRAAVWGLRSSLRGDEKSQRCWQQSRAVLRFVLTGSQP
jgi:GT2 family glycosyltransferase